MLNFIDYKNNSGIKKDFTYLCKEAFPWNEIPPPCILLKKAMSPSNTLFCIYEEQEFIGLTYLINKNDICYVFLLAVHPNKRSKHYGEKILTEIKRMYKEKTILLSYEEVDQKYKNYEQRLRRKAFYDRNGFYPIALISQEFFVRYQVASSNINKNVTYKDYAEILSLVFGKCWVSLFFKEIKN